MFFVAHRETMTVQRSVSDVPSIRDGRWIALTRYAEFVHDAP
jgi:hypothetical protein